MTYTEEQENAINEIKCWINDSTKNVLSLSGVGGSGKTTILTAVKNYMPSANWTALTGKAASRLSQVVGVNATTLHYVLYKQPDKLENGEIEFNTVKQPQCKFLIIDEASMIPPKIWNHLKMWLNNGIKILFIGDPFQLPPVLTSDDVKIYGNNFSIFNIVNGPVLTKPIRNTDDIIAVSSLLRDMGKVECNSNSSYSFIKTDDPIDYALNEYFIDRDDHVLITWRNQVRMNANKRLRDRFGIVGDLPDKDEPVLFCKNGYGVLNGEIKTTKSLVPGPSLNGITTYWLTTNDNKKILVSTDGKELKLDGGSPPIGKWNSYLKDKKKYNVSDPIPITYGYVLTAHKSQGSEYKNVSVFMNKSDLLSKQFNVMTKLPDNNNMSFSIRWLYTAFSRAKQHLNFIVD